MVAHKVDMIESAEGTPSIMPPQSLIFGSTRDELAEVVDRATSLSCSLGSASAHAATRLEPSTAGRGARPQHEWLPSRRRLPRHPWCALAAAPLTSPDLARSRPISPSQWAT